MEPIVRSMPLEYAVELNKLIELEVTGYDPDVKYGQGLSFDYVD